MSAEAGKLEFVNWLLLHGADPNSTLLPLLSFYSVKDTSPPDGKSAFQLAKDKNLQPIMVALRQAGGAKEEATQSGCCVVS